jgi:hypothetical protein
MSYLSELTGNWEPHSKGVTFPGDSKPFFLNDTMTRKRYVNLTDFEIRAKFAKTFFTSPFYHAIPAIANVVFSIFSIVSLKALRMTGIPNAERKAMVVRDFKRIILTTLAYVGMQIAIIYGLITPNNGRKVYASLGSYLNEKWMIDPALYPHGAFNHLRPADFA